MELEELKPNADWVLDDGCWMLMACLFTLKFEVWTLNFGLTSFSGHTSRVSYGRKFTSSLQHPSFTTRHPIHSSFINTRYSYFMFAVTAVTFTVTRNRLIIYNIEDGWQRDSKNKNYFFTALFSFLLSLKRMYFCYKLWCNMGWDT